MWASLSTNSPTSQSGIANETIDCNLQVEAYQKRDKKLTSMKIRGEAVTVHKNVFYCSSIIFTDAKSFIYCCYI